VKINKVIIIGAGPAGLSVAIQLKRFGIDSLIIEQNIIGGLLNNANLVENYLGFPQGISGVELVELMKKQYFQYNLDYLQDKVCNISKGEQFYKVKTEQQTLFSENIIIASGTKGRTLKTQIDKNAESLSLNEIHAIKDVKNKAITIIGAGDSAFDYAMNLSRYNDVTILNRSKCVKALPLLIDRVVNNPNITYIEDMQMVNANKTNNRLKISCKNTRDDVLTSFMADYLVVAIGRDANLNFIEHDIIEKNKNESLYLIGDVQNGLLRQTAIAVGDGLKVANIIHNKG